MIKTVVNPYLPSYEYIPDGEPHIFGDRLYVFGSHDKFKGNAFCMNDYVCWSAPINDLSDWKFHGKIYKRSFDPTPIEDDTRYMWAPDVVQGKDDRFYLYYLLQWYNRVKVAVCDSPCGEYKYLGEVHYSDGTPFGAKPLEKMRFDPALLNDNGKFYLYTGFSSNAPWHKAKCEKFGIGYNDLGNQVVELSNDMLTVISSPKPVIAGTGNSQGTSFLGHEFFEASSIRKFGDKYYAVYSSVKAHELCYAVSDYPDKDFTYGGVLHDNGNFVNGCEESFYWGNNHGSLICIGGKYYIFAHRQTYKNTYSRQGVAEEIKFVNGKFIQAEMTSQGLYGKPLPTVGIYEGGIACVLYRKGKACHVDNNGKDDPYIFQDGEDREENPNQYVAHLSNGSVVGYKYFDIDKDVALTLTVKNHNADGKLELCFNRNFNDVKTASVVGDKIVFNLSKSGSKPIYFRYLGKGYIDLISLKWN